MSRYVTMSNGMWRAVTLTTFVTGVLLGGTGALQWTKGVCRSEMTVAPSGDMIEDMRRVENLLTAEGYQVAGFAHRPAPRVLISSEIPIDCRPMMRAYMLTRVALRTYNITEIYAVEHGGDRALAEDFEKDTAHAIAAVFDDTDQTGCLGRQINGEP